MPIRETKETGCEGICPHPNLCRRRNGCMKMLRRKARQGGTRPDRRWAKNVIPFRRPDHEASEPS